MIDATRILVLIGAFAFACGGTDSLAQTKDQPSTTKSAKDAATQPAPVKDATAPTKDGDDAKNAAKKDDAPKDETPVTNPPVPPVQPVVEAKPPRYKVVPASQAAASVLGSLDAEKHDLEVTLTAMGAAIQQVQFSKYKQAVEGDEPYQITGPVKTPAAVAAVLYEPAMAAWAVVVNKFNLDLFDRAWTVESPGVFSIQVVDADGEPVLKIKRTYTLDGYELKCHTTFENQTGKAVEVVWRQNAIGDVPKESDYRGDARQVTLGYHDLDYDPEGIHVYTDEGSFTRQAMLDEYEEKIAGGLATELEVLADQVDVTTAQLDRIKAAPPFWPHEDAPPAQIVWLASINRYFTSIIYRPLEDVTEANEKQAVALPLDGRAGIFQSAIGISKTGERAGRNDYRQITFTLTSHPITIEPGATHDIALAVYHGPRQSKLLQSTFNYRVLELEEHLVRYELGCTVCLFQGLADFLLGFLNLLHGIVFDWGISIVILVLCVRLLLHPLTKKAQISMTVMGKQMASIQPEMAKIKEKFKNDSQRQQQEMMKLYREKGINPLGFLGCLPMFLQMPIWIALYAMLWGAIELRHEPAFFGIFQSINSDWKFLADLSTYDNFISFGGKGFDLPLCGIHIPAALNILPLLMAVMFYFQQKLASPEPTTDQQKQQQKMMKFMVFLFPIMLYPAPSGLTLYILASSTAGMIDSYLVRKHIKQMEADGTLFKKKERKPGGFMDRLGQAVEAKQKELKSRETALQGKKGGGRPGGGKGKRKR